MRRLREALGYAELVEERRRFAVRHLLGTRGAKLYRPLGAPVRVAIRHAAGDPFVLREVWDSGDYLPPPEVDARLRRRPGRPLRVLDVGAHAGLFSAWMLARYGDVSVVALEPDPHNRAALARTIRANPAAGRWTVIAAAAGTAEGTVAFVAGRGALSRVARPEESCTLEVPVVDVLPHMAGADLVKLDIEGGEWAVLADPRLAEARPAAIVLEWHSVPECPSVNPKGRAVDALRALGYEVHHPPRYAAVPLEGPVWAAGVVWAWLPNREILRA